jgi:AraC-like DNA-binding protein
MRGIRTVQQLPPNKPAIRRDEDGSARILLDFITVNLHRPLTTPQLARAAAISPRTLSRLTTRTFGCSPHRLVTRLRVRRASTLLLDGWKVEAVVAEVGYSSRINFYRAFERVVGMTPAAYRDSGTGRIRDRLRRGAKPASGGER